MLDFLLALMTAASVAVLLIPLLRVRVTSAGRLDRALAIYRDQLAEVERERTAGSLSETDASAARTEIERRILTAGDLDSSSGPRASRPASSSSLHKYLSPALCLLVPAIALGIYLQIGAPGLPSAPFAPRAASPAGAPPQTEPALTQEITAARARLAAAPDDPDTLAALAELLAMEAQGIVTREAVDAFTKALAKNPDDPRALFYLGLHDAQAGDSKAALQRWLDLEAQSPADAPWLPTLRAEIARVAREAKLDPQQIKPDRKPPTEAAAAPPSMSTAPGMPQPTPEQREAMAKMTPAERQQAIRGMVDGLEARLRDGPHDKPEDRDAWLRLANARRVLGQADLSAEAYAKADAIQPLDAAALADWAETEVRQIQPGVPPSARAVQVLARLEKADPGNALALFYLGADSFAKGDKAEAARRWKALLGRLPADAPIRAMLEAKIKEAE